jgi:hypothetical protein
MAYQHLAAYASTESAHYVMVSAKRRQLSYNIQFDRKPSRTALSARFLWLTPPHRKDTIDRGLRPTAAPAQLSIAVPTSLNFSRFFVVSSLLFRYIELMLPSI